MRNSLKGLALVAGLATMAAGRANAQWAWSGCGGTLFNTCASVNITLVGSTLTLTVQNWGNFNPSTNTFASLSGSSTFTAIGIANYGGGAFTLSGNGSCINDATCDWDDGLAGLPEAQDGAKASPPPVVDGLNPPAAPGVGQFTQVVLTFNVTSGTVDLSSATFALHGQSGPRDLSSTNPNATCSTKLIVTKSGSTYTPNQVTAANQCDSFNPPTETPVPEPASMVLLATGLVAMSGAGIIRRRRNRKV